ncbi:biotin carboxylase N-terminal domain-containing protein [Qaidamihabitans albus]|uniref:biotin carboxylase N-terminal domain-containing protein n=1 Tax=Qaidamihabitans albus TaxID=2795733 RepID=UPI0018F1A02A|nr:biotin carboxylase N-terminal domain-containing protein [Qaidamihabitans albus]
MLISNLGEIAVRIARAVRELDMRAVAVYPADDAASGHVDAADETMALPGVGTAAHLDIDALIGAARDAGCSAVHRGYGFLSENAGFARGCRDAGLTFIGPSAEVLELFGEKSAARDFAEQAGVPVLPGTAGPATVAETRSFAAEHGPVMLKAGAGAVCITVRP